MTDNISGAIWEGWEVVSIIGRGAFGIVYEIKREVLGVTERSALKVISLPRNSNDIDELYSDGYDEESIRSTFNEHLKGIVAEYNLMKKMSGCSNIVNCEDLKYVPHDDGIGWDIFIRMELLTPLTKTLPEQFDEKIVIDIAKDMCCALELCEKNNIIHRDIKPQNILLSTNGDYKLGDFGIAKTVEKTSGGTKIGTPNYMAPEVYNNMPYGNTADIYSLGLVLYWLLNEKRLPLLPLPPQTINASMDEDARNRRLAGEEFSAPKNGSEQLKAIVLKACSYNPEERYTSATEMLRELSAITNSSFASEIEKTICVDESCAPVDKKVSKVQQKSNKKYIIAAISVLCFVVLFIVGIGIADKDDSTTIYDPGLNNVFTEATSGESISDDISASDDIDCIVEQGTNGNWTYRKWSSGVAECWGTISITLAKDAYELTPGIYGASGYCPLPKNVFTAYDCVAVDPIKWYQLNASGRITAGGTIEATILGKEQMSSLKAGDTVLVNCVVNGMWK